MRDRIRIVLLCQRNVDEFLLHAVEILLCQILQVDQAIARSLRDSDQLVDFQLQRFGIPVLCALDQEDHQKCDNRGAGVYHQLPCVGELEQWAGDGSDENHDDSHGKGVSPATLSGRPLRGSVEQRADPVGHGLDISATERSLLRDAFDFVGAGEAFDHSAYISLDTGKIYWRSTDADLQEGDLPEDLDDSDQYLAVPSQRELGLGRRLALAFAMDELPDDYVTVAGCFRRRGAYGRFKGFLDTRGKLERWYEFENKATDEALAAWCAEHGIEPVAGSPAS
jgi:hypothetical protein